MSDQPKNTRKGRGKLKWFYLDPENNKMIPAEDEAGAKAAARVLGAKIYQAKSADEARQMHEQGK